MQEYDYQPKKVADALGISVYAFREFLDKNDLNKHCIVRKNRLRIPAAFTRKLLGLAPGEPFPPMRQKGKPKNKKFLTIKDYQAMLKNEVSE